MLTEKMHGEVQAVLSSSGVSVRSHVRKPVAAIREEDQGGGGSTDLG